MCSSECVIILHGILRTSKDMRRLASYLENQGYTVYNLDYPSTRHDLAELITFVGQAINCLDLDDQTVHLVGFSMGALIVRALVKHFRPARLGRVVQLAPPNQGSEVADFLRGFYPFRRLFGPAGQQLGTDQSAITHLFGPVDYELGIIAGSFSIDPISSLLIGGVNDGKVSIERTKLSGMKEHIIVNACHTWFPHNKEVQRLTGNFLKTGSFTL